MQSVITSPQQKTESTNALASQSAKPETRFCTLSQKRSTLSALAEEILRSYRGSLLRQVLRVLRSSYHRIRFERSICGTLRFDLVRQCVPQVPCSDSRNEMQFCSRSIQSLEQARPYMTLADAELFLQGWFQAARWYAHLDSQSGKSGPNSSHTSEDAPILRRALVVRQSTKRDRLDPLPSRESRGCIVAGEQSANRSREQPTTVFKTLPPKRSAVAFDSRSEHSHSSIIRRSSVMSA